MCGHLLDLEQRIAAGEYGPEARALIANRPSETQRAMAETHAAQARESRERWRRLQGEHEARRAERDRAGHWWTPEPGVVHRMRMLPPQDDEEELQPRDADSPFYEPDTITLPVLHIGDRVRFTLEDQRNHHGIVEEIDNRRREVIFRCAGHRCAAQQLKHVAHLADLALFNSPPRNDPPPEPPPTGRRIRL